MYDYSGRPAFDEKDAELLAARIVDRDKIDGPRIGDFVQFADGTLHRFSHDWGEDIQHSEHGSFYFGREGWVDFSGSLFQAILKSKLRPIGDRPGRFWFFHHDLTGAHRGVDCEAPCRVYAYDGEKPQY